MKFRKIKNCQMKINYRISKFKIQNLSLKHNKLNKINILTLYIQLFVRIPKLANKIN